MFHELRAILGGEKQSQGTASRGCGAPSAKQEPREEARTLDQLSESLDSSSALMQTTPKVTVPLWASVSHTQNINMNLLGLPTGLL